ncbi:hypothetical protein FRC11_003857 [Ceratobasidium sp. 423]|nr:hypothetical protein FRC11_003857 [Ceratobasidium sp. 423]
MGDEAMGEDNTPRCVRALRLLAEAGTSLHELLDDVLLGDPEARSLKPVVEARSSLYKSGVLTRVLSCIRQPPDRMKIRGKQHKAAKSEIEKWANDTTVDILQLELAKQAKSTRATDVESEVYLKAKGVPKSCHFFLQRASLSLSYEWSRQTLEKISAAAMSEVIALFEEHTCITLYDNIRLAYPIKHERSSQKTVTDNGTAMTIIPVINKERVCQIQHHWLRLTLVCSSLVNQGLTNTHIADAMAWTDYKALYATGS